MANIDSSLKNWSTTASSNQPDAADAATVQADFQQLQATVRQDLAHKGADIASAGTTDLGAVPGLMHDITGTTTITSFGTVSAGIWKIIKFEGALTLTHNATSLILPGGANITTADGDVAIAISEGSGNWRVVSYVPATGRPVINTLLDSQFKLADNGDTTKLLAFEVSGITTGTTRTITVPDSSGTLPLLGLAQTFSALQTFSAGITLSGTASNIALGSNYLSNGGTDAGLSFDGSNNATFSAALAAGNTSITGTLNSTGNYVHNSRVTIGTAFIADASGTGNNVGIAFGAGPAILPTVGNGTATNNTVDLGSSTYKFKDGFFSGNLTVTGTGTSSLAGALKTGGYTVATLPANAAGLIAYVTDQNAAAAAKGVAPAGGGAVVCYVMNTGAGWVGI